MPWPVLRWGGSHEGSQEWSCSSDQEAWSQASLLSCFYFSEICFKEWFTPQCTDSNRFLVMGLVCGVVSLVVTLYRKNGQEVWRLSVHNERPKPFWAEQNILSRYLDFNGLHFNFKKTQLNWTILQLSRVIIHSNQSLECQFQYLLLLMWLRKWLWVTVFDTSRHL